MFCMCIGRGCVGTGESRVMFCMCIDRGCVGTGESKLCSVSVLAEGALVQGRVSYVLYVY